MPRYDAEGHLRRQVRELESIIASFYAMVEQKATTLDLVSDHDVMAGPEMFGVRSLLVMEAKHARQLATEYADRATNAAQTALPPTVTKTKRGFTVTHNVDPLTGQPWEKGEGPNV